MAKNLKKRKPGEPREIYHQRRIRELNLKLALVKDNPFTWCTANGLMAHEIRGMYQDWEQSVVDRSKADRQAREQMRKDDL